MQENYIVGIYARLSRDDERAGESVSIENQKEMLSRYVREQGWTLYDYYCDDGVSGTTEPTGAGRHGSQDQSCPLQRPIAPR